MTGYQYTTEWLGTLGDNERNIVLGAVGSLVATSIVVLISLSVQLVSQAILLKNRTGFSWLPREWLCEWEPESECQPDWVKERLVIRRFFGTLILKNKQNSAEYRYRAEARLASGERLDGKYLLGTWYDLREGASAAGVFMLTIEHRGGFLYGYIVGPNDEGPIMYGKYVVGRTEHDIQQAKRMLRFSDSISPLKSSTETV